MPRNLIRFPQLLQYLRGNSAPARFTEAGCIIGASRPNGIQKFEENLDVVFVVNDNLNHISAPLRGCRRYTRHKIPHIESEP